MIPSDLSASLLPEPGDLASCPRAQLLHQLRVMAIAQFGDEPAGHTLQPTAVVHEAWIRIARQARGSLETEASFRQWAGRIVRQVLVDHARRRRADRRDVGRRSPLGPDHGAECRDLSPDELLALSDLLDRLAATQPRQAAVVEMRYFGGMKEEAIAERLGVTTRTVRSDWVAARAWLYGMMVAP